MIKRRSPSSSCRFIIDFTRNFEISFYIYHATRLSIIQDLKALRKEFIRRLNKRLGTNYLWKLISNRLN